MSIIYYSLLFGLTIFLIAMIKSLITKQEDYMLDDYTEKDSPDNVRVIKTPPKVKYIDRVEEKIIEKEVIVNDENKIKKLNDYISDLEYERDILKDEISGVKVKDKKVIEDRDYFINILEEKEKEIDELKKNLSDIKKENIRDTLKEGNDSYGHFYHIDYIQEVFSKKISNEILDVYDKISIDNTNFAYFTINNQNDKKHVEIIDKANINDYFKKINNWNKTKGKYTIFIIVDDKVYKKEIH